MNRAESMGQPLATGTLPGGASFIIRPIRPDDAPLLAVFHAGLSEESVYLRYFEPLPLNRRIAPDRLAERCRPGEQEWVLVAELTDAPHLLGVARLSELGTTPVAECAVVVQDVYQGQGVGSALLRTLLAQAHEAGLTRIVAEVLPENAAMRHVFEHLGFTVRYEPEEHVYTVSLDL